MRRTAEDRRTAITLAARTLFARQGFHGTGMAQIARKSGILVGQIYRDFASKEDLIAAIVERDIDELLNDPAMSQETRAVPSDQFASWVRRFINRDLDEESCSVLTNILSEARRNPRIAAILILAYERLRERLEEAAMIWAPGPEHAAAREELADLILTAAGAIQYRNIFAIATKEGLVASLVGLVEAELRRIQPDA